MEFGEIFLIIFFILIGYIIRHITTIYQLVKLRNTYMGRNEAVAEICWQSRKIFTKIIDLNKLDFDFSTKKFKIDSAKTYFKKNCPVLFYRDDDTNPVEPTAMRTITEAQEKAARKEAPEILQEQTRNIFSLLLATLMSDEGAAIKLIKIAVIIAAIVGIINLVMTFSANGAIGTCNSEILLVKNMVNATLAH